MELSYFGLSCFRIKYRDTTLFTDPFDNKEVGLALAPQEADVVLYSRPEKEVGVKVREKIRPTPARLEKAKKLVEIFEPGEYEIGGMIIRAYGLPSVFIISFDDVTIGYMGMRSEKVPTDAFDEVNDVDYLIVPVGGGDLWGTKEADQLIKDIEPGVVIPCCYRQPGMTGSYSKLGGVEDFLKEMGVGTVEPEKKLKIVDIPEAEDRKIKYMVLDRMG